MFNHLIFHDAWCFYSIKLLLFIPIDFLNMPHAMKVKTNAPKSTSKMHECCCHALQDLSNMEIALPMLVQTVPI